MRLPSTAELDQAIRASMILKAEDLSLVTLGGRAGSDLASRLIGVEVDEQTPASDSLIGREAEIQIDRLQITTTARELLRQLQERAVSYPGSDKIDPDFLEQEYLDFVEYFCGTLPSTALGGWDYTAAARGPFLQLLAAGRAWRHLLADIVTGALGEPVRELTITDLAILSELDIRTMRNRVGPGQRIRTIPGDRATTVYPDRIDALEWLRTRRNFRIQLFDPMPFLRQQPSNPADRAEAMLTLALARLGPLGGIAEMMNIDVDTLRSLRTAPNSDLIERLGQVIAFAHRNSGTSPTPPSALASMG